MRNISPEAVIFTWLYGVFVSLLVLGLLISFSGMIGRLGEFLAWIAANDMLVISGIIASGAIFGFVIAATSLGSDV